MLGHLKFHLNKSGAHGLRAPAIPYIMLAITAASAAASYDASQKQANAQTKAAWDNYNAQKNALQEQTNQIQQAASNEENERYRQAMLDEGKIRTAAGESGVAGLSLDRLINDAEFQGQLDMQSIEQNKTNRIKQAGLEGVAAFSRAASSQNIADASRKTLASTGLQIASSGYTYGKEAGWFNKT